MKSVLVSLSMLLVTGLAHAEGMACERLKNLRLPHVQITSAAAVAAGAFEPSGNAAGGPPGAATRMAATLKQLPAFCRVTATSRPSADSSIGIEVWLPATGWNGRLAASGNGGFGSNIAINALAEGLAKGYAVTATDTGHDGQDDTFAIGHPQKLLDWDNRAVHEMATLAKAVVAAHYGMPAKYSYFASCSTGGRQAEVAAEYYPRDFDGIVAGDAANPMTRLQAGSLWATAAVNQSTESYLSNDKWALIHKAVIDACDAKDGLKDGLVEDPRACNFDINILRCKSGDAPDCLTAPQIEAVNKITAGLKNSRTGELLYPGWLLGTAMQPSPVAGKTPDRSATTTFRALFQDGNWDYHTIDFDTDVARADQLADKSMNAVDETRLGSLFSHGGKLLIYHGWFDPNISALAAIEYYEKAVATNGGLSRTYNSVRLFMIPNMNHCGGGEGPSNFDKLDVISTWVEQGKAPDQIVASHLNAQGEVDRTRPLCPYPRVARYRGSGSIDDAQNFVCAAP